MKEHCILQGKYYTKEEIRNIKNSLRVHKNITPEVQDKGRHKLTVFSINIIRWTDSFTCS